MRLRRDPQALAKVQASAYFIASYPFFTPDPLVVELGMGKGEMISILAQQDLKSFYVGIDYEASVAIKAVRRASNLELTNFKVIVGEAKDLPTFFKDSIQTLWLTFPDPWPKARHAKRRLTARRFLSIYAKALAPGASIMFKTDNDALFNWSLVEFVAAGFKIEFQTNDLHSSAYVASNVMTGYEAKWSARGKTINFLKATFVGSIKRNL